MPIRVGDKASRDFVVDQRAMTWFQSVAEDMSRIHTDAAYAQERGYDGVIAYGGIMLAHLSHLLGARIPGADGTSVKWTINYRKPLYLDEPATVEIEVVAVSTAVGLVECKFTIATKDRTVATGITQSIVPIGNIAQ
jgi:acyl dehydratase